MKNRKLLAVVALVGGAAWVFIALTSWKPIFTCMAAPLLYLAYYLFTKSEKDEQ